MLDGKVCFGFYSSVNVAVTYFHMSSSTSFQQLAAEVVSKTHVGIDRCQHQRIFVGFGNSCNVSHFFNLRENVVY